MGNVYVKQKKVDIALEQFKKSLTLAKSVYKKDEENLAVSAVLNDLANVCVSFERYPLALGYYEKAIVINKTLSKEYKMADLELSTNYHGMGNLYKKQEKFEKALKYY